jgi:hypothetical protein
MAAALPVVIYVLCFVTCVACAWLLWRGYRHSGARLLLWSGICFAFLSVNNLAVIFDIVVFPGNDLQVLRHAAALAGLSALLFGMIWESE